MIMTDKLADNILVIIKRDDKIINIIKGHNIVTDDGDIHYAKKVIGESSDLDTLYLRLGTGTDNPTKQDTDVETYVDGSGHSIDSGFPQRNFTDEGNSDGGENVITYRITYDVGDVVANNISEGALTDDPSSPTKALNHFLFDESFDVTDNDQLIVYINHAFVGV